MTKLIITFIMIHNSIIIIVIAITINIITILLLIVLVMIDFYSDLVIIFSHDLVMPNTVLIDFVTIRSIFSNPRPPPSDWFFIFGVAFIKY